MEFIQFLDRDEIEILRMVEQAGYSTEEDTALCLINENYVGFLKKNKRKIIICTNNAKKRENYKLLRNKDSDTFERPAK